MNLQHIVILHSQSYKAHITVAWKRGICEKDAFEMWTSIIRPLSGKSKPHVTTDTTANRRHKVKCLWLWF